VEDEMALDTGRRNAIARALAHGGAAAVARVRYGVYRVASATRPGRAHTVSVDARGRYACTCEAALAGRAACWHRAAVWIAKVEHAGQGRWRVTGPAPAAPRPAPADVVDVRTRRAA
jgi:hypothetical protein